ncbi:MAG: SpoIID/LytB domain-containing protein [bacterium]|jgi:stage II sporulation protein D
MWRYFILSFIFFFSYLKLINAYNFYKSNFSLLVNDESYDIVRVLIDSGYIGNGLEFRGKNISLRYSLKKYPSIYQGSNNLFNFLSINYNYPYLDYYYSQNKYSINLDDLYNIVILSDNFIEYKNKKYKGIVRLIFQKDKYYLINYINLEDYLKSVVPSEMPYTWNIEALKSQAVAARTYTIKMMINRRSKKEIFDVYSTVLDQAYYGIDYERDTTNFAVDSTKGMILIFNNEPIWALYHSNCGGYTIDGYLPFNKLVSKDDYYLSSVKCFYPGNTWVSKINLYEIKNLLKKYTNKDVYSINNISVSSFKTTFIYQTINNTFANYSIYNWDLRKALNYKIKSPFIDKVKIEGDWVIFEGKGSGHGVGLCQYGANYMAKAGYNYIQILNHYYPNATLISISDYFSKFYKNKK